MNDKIKDRFKGILVIIMGVVFWGGTFLLIVGIRSQLEQTYYGPQQESRDDLRVLRADVEEMKVKIYTEQRTILTTNMSYYGKALHGNGMANGQKFDMNKITCAAADWIPMGSILHVRLAGSHDPWVKIPVTDRGNFEGLGRGIDASQAAYLATGAPLSRGVVKVEYWIEEAPK